MKDMSIQKKYPAIKLMKLPQLRRILFYTLLVSLFSACIKDDLYKTSHPGKGAVIVTTHWEKFSRAFNNDGYLLEMDGNKINVTEDSLVLPGLYIPAMHKLRVYTQSEGIVLNGSVISINSKGGSFLYEPDQIYFAVKNVNVIADDTVYVEITPRQWIKNLRLILNITEGDPEKIHTAQGTLEGVVAKADLEQNILLKETGMLSLHFVRQRNILTASGRLLGVSSTRQLLLNVILTFTDGRTQTIQNDLTDLLKGINECEEPFIIEGELNTPVHSDVQATITGWKVYEDHIELH